MRIVNPLAVQPQVFFADLAYFSRSKPFLYNPIDEIYNKALKLRHIEAEFVIFAW